MAGKKSALSKKKRKKLFTRIITISVVVIMAGSILLATLLTHWY